VLRFAVRRPGNPVASPRSHGVPRRDVLGCVHVGVAGVSTGRAPEPRLALARLPVHVPASAAALARECGIDLLNPTDSLLVQTADEKAPAGQEDLAVQSSLPAHASTGIAEGSFGAPGHVLDAQLLNADHVELARQISADFLTPVLSGVSLMGLKPSDGKPGPHAAVTAALRASQPPLQQTHASQAHLAELGTVQQFASRQCRAHGHAAVNADDLTGAGTCNRLGNRNECHMPPADSIQGDAEGLGSVWDGTRPAKPDPSALLDEHLAGFPIQPAHMLGSNRDDTKSFVAASLAPSGLAVGASKEVPHSLIKIAKRLLLYHLTARGKPSIVASRDGELPALLQVPRCTHTPWSPPRLLLAGEVPYEPRMRTVFAQCRFLSSRRKQAVARHTKTLSSTADIPEEVKRRVQPCLTTGVTAPRTA